MSIFTDGKYALRVSDADQDLAGYAGTKAAEVIFNKVRMWGQDRDEERVNDLFDRAGDAFEALFKDRGYKPDFVDSLASAAMETCICHFNRLDIEADIVRRL